MRSQGGRTSSTRLTPVDAEPPARVRPLSSTEIDLRHSDPLFEERLLRAQFKRERSSAYWFAASTWGIGALVVGACLGAFMMHMAQVSSIDAAVGAYDRGRFSAEVTDSVRAAAGIDGASNAGGQGSR